MVENSPNDGSSGSGSGTPDDRPARARRERFLGEADVDVKRAPSGAGARALMLTSTFAVLVILLIAIVYALRDEVGERVLITVAATKYASDLVPPLDFAQQDLAGIRSAPGVQLNPVADRRALPNFATRDDLSRLKDRVLRDVQQDTLILYLRLHAVADDEGELSMIPADYDPRRGEGSSFRSLLQAVADAPAKNKIVFADVEQSSQDLRLGWIGAQPPGDVDDDDPAEGEQAELAAGDDAAGDSDTGDAEEGEAGYFARVFRDVVGDDPASNVHLVCATRGRQRSGAVVSVQNTIFGGLVSYCLHGGTAADGAGADGELGDGLLSASEISTFLERSIADWSLNQKSAIQTPLWLHAGPDRDFFVARVNPVLSLDAYFADREPLAQAGEAENERRQQQSQQQPADEAAAPELQPLPTTATVVAALMNSWDQRQSLQSTSAPVQRPRHWAFLNQQLRRAEQLLLAGQVEQAAEVIETYADTVVEKLQAEPDELISEPWSLAFTDLMEEQSSATRWRDAVQSAVELPTQNVLNRLGGVPFVEGELVYRARDRLATGSTEEDAAWTDSELLLLAVGTRGLAEDVARLACRRDIDESADGVRSRPELLPVLTNDVERADAARISAELELSVGRLESARDGFESAAAEYEAARRQCGNRQRQLHDLHLALVEAESLARWMLQTPQESVWHDEMSRELAALLRGSAEFRRSPRPELLLTLVTLSKDLREAGVAAADGAADSGDPQALRAALELPFIEPGLRAEMLLRLIDQVDGPTSASIFATPDLGEPGVAGPLAEAFAETLSGETLAEDRAASYREILSELSRNASTPPSGGTGYEQYLTHLVRAPFQGTLAELRRTSFRSTVSDELMTRMTTDHLEWQVSRLDRAQFATGANLFVPRSVILNNLQALNPFHESQRRLRQAFTSTDIEVARGEAGRLLLSFQLNGSVDLVDSDDPQLVIDWYPLKSRWTFHSAYASSGTEIPVAEGSEEGAEWRLHVPLQGLVSGNQAGVVVEFEPVTQDDETAARPTEQLPGWIETADGSRYWTPVSLDVGLDLLDPLRFTVAEKDGEALPDVIKLYPNQRLPLDMRLRGQGADADDLVVEVLSGKKALPIDAVSEAVAADFRLPLAEAGFELRATADGEVVASRRVGVEVLNPSRSFICECDFDAQTRTVSAVIRRLDASFLPEAVSAQMTVHNVGIEGGNMLAEMPVDADEVTLSAVLADSQLARYEVSIGVCGVPGTFHYAIDRITGLAERWPRTHISIDSPKHAAVFDFTADLSARIPVRVLADGDDEVLVSVGVDRNNDDYLQPDERIETFSTWSGKAVRTELVSSIEPAELAIESSVANVVAHVPAAGLLGPQRLLAQLADSNLSKAQSVVHFVRAAPAVEFEAPQRNDRIAYGDPLNVVLQSDESSGGAAIERVEVGVDRNFNGEWDDDETLTPLEPPESSPDGSFGPTIISFDTLELFETGEESGGSSPAEGEEQAPTEEESLRLPRSVVLMARATTPIKDLLDPKAPPQSVTSAVSRRRIEIVPQSTEPPPAGAISGYVVTADGLRQRDVEVALGETVTTSDDDGRFQISDLPQGTYVLDAAKGLRAGQVEVEVLAGETTKDVEILIAR